MRPGQGVIDHEAAHGAAAELVGIDVDGYRFDSGWDGWLGMTLLSDHALRALEGGYPDRLAIATLCYMPYVVMLGEPYGRSDMAVVDEMAPTGYSRSLWRWIVEENALRLFRSEGFADAFAAARHRIEQSA